MSVILTLTATSTGDGAITSTTSGIALTDILTGAVIVCVALLASLVVTELLSSRQGWSEKAAVTVRGINVTLLIIFCAFVHSRPHSYYRQKGEHPEQEYVVDRLHRDDKRQVFCFVKCDAKEDPYSECEEQLVVVGEA